MMETEAGKQIAADVAELSDWCEKKGLDFDEVTKLFDKFAENSPIDLPSTVRAFKNMLYQRWTVYAGDEGEEIEAARRLVLPGDKDFQESVSELRRL